MRGSARKGSVPFLACAAGLLLLAPAAGAQTPGSTRPDPARDLATSVADPNALRTPPSTDRPPAGHVRSAREVVAIADRVPKIAREVQRKKASKGSAFLKGNTRWQVSYYDDGREIGQVLIDDSTGKVIEAWTGHQVAWSMARGYPGAFGRKVTALYVWIPLLVLFVLPFVDPRRPFRLLHLDLLVLCSFSVSLAFFLDGRIDPSVPLAYPPLVYLLVRALFAAFRPRPPRAPIRLLVPASWLVVAIVFLAGFRVGLNVVNGNVIDVGYAGVIGADKLMDGEPLYGEFPKDNEHGDTYGPVNYYAYVPFEQALPWSGGWDDLPAAHGAAIAFDLLTLVGLFFLGRRIRGPNLGIAMAYAWASYPFTIFALNSGANDSLVALLVVVALLAVGRPAMGGAAVVMAPVLLGGDLGAFYERTIEYQNERGSPFSVWGLYDLDTAQTVAKAAAVLLALIVAFIPRRRDERTLCALAAAVLIVLQLGVTHWFYLYIVWFLPPLFAALLAPPAPAAREPEARRAPEQESPPVAEPAPA